MLPLKGACTQIVYTLSLKYLYRDYTEAKVYDIWVHGPSGFRTCQVKLLAPPAGSAASMLLGRHGSLGVFAPGISRFLTLSLTNSRAKHRDISIRSMGSG